MEQHVSSFLHSLYSQGQKVGAEAAHSFKSAMDTVTKDAHHAKSDVVSWAHSVPGAVTTVNHRIETSAEQAFHKTNQIFADAFKTTTHAADTAVSGVFHQVTSVFGTIWGDLPLWLKIAIAVIAVGAISLSLWGGKQGLNAAKSGFQYVKENPAVLATPFLL